MQARGMTDAASLPPGPPPPAQPNELPWLQWRVGERVVVRYRIDGGASDALGDLVEVRPDGVVVRTRRGDVEVPAAVMITGKRVPPPPPRRPAPPTARPAG